MRLKKILLAMLRVALSLGGCNKESTFEQSVNYRTYNVVFPLKSQAEPTFSEAHYLFHFTDNLSDSFSTSIQVGYEELKVDVSGFRSQSASTPNGGMFTIEGGTGKAGNDQTVTDISGAVTGIVYYSMEEVIGIPTISPSEYGPHTFLSYKIGDSYLVKTFFPDLYFKGTTNTQYKYKGEDKTYENKNILYRLVFNKFFNKADLVIYEGKFAAEQPSSGVYKYLVLKNLPVVFKDGGYSIEASNIIPQYPEGGTLESQQYFVFNRISIKSGQDTLADISIDFDVAGMYKGEFRGACAVTNILK